MLDDGVARFQRKFPGGFLNPEYERRERSYRGAANGAFVETGGRGVGGGFWRKGRTPHLVGPALKRFSPEKKAKYRLLHWMEFVAFRRVSSVRRSLPAGSSRLSWT